MGWDGMGWERARGRPSLPPALNADRGGRRQHSRSASPERSRQRVGGQEGRRRRGERYRDRIEHIERRTGIAAGGGAGPCPAEAAPRPPRGCPAAPARRRAGAGAPQTRAPEVSGGRGPGTGKGSGGTRHTCPAGPCGRRHPNRRRECGEGSGVCVPPPSPALVAPRGAGIPAGFSPSPLLSYRLCFYRFPCLAFSRFVRFIRFIFNFKNASRCMKTLRFQFSFALLSCQRQQPVEGNPVSSQVFSVPPGTWPYGDILLALNRPRRAPGFLFSLLSASC